MPQQESQLPLVTQVGQPVPVEGRLAADDEVRLFKWLQGGEEVGEFLGVKVPVQMLSTLLVHNTHVHRVGMEVDTAVEFVLSIVELHRELP